MIDIRFRNTSGEERPYLYCQDNKYTYFSYTNPKYSKDVILIRINYVNK